MKAGTALGLLAGLGAMNAMSGKPYGGKRFTGLLDMLDGGGAGASGDKFEGGGLLSALGNLFMKPMRAQQNVERIASDTAATKTVTDVLKKMAEGGTLTTKLDGKDGLGYDYNSQDIYGIGAGGEYGGLPVPDVLGSTASPNVLSSGIVQPISADLAGEVDSLPIIPAPIDKVPSLYSSTGGSDISYEPFSANSPSAAAMTPPTPAPSDRDPQLASFNRRAETVPEMFRGSEIEGMYRDYLLKGGLGTFAQFTNQSMAIEDPAVARSPTPPALISPDVPITRFN